MTRPFLTAQWRDLLIASYAVDSAQLEPLLPPGLVLDRFEGCAVCSLVGFRFLDTRVRGVRWPGHVNFPEINLRFYVREDAGRGGRRGVVFVKEIVPSPIIAGVARLLYNEPYRRGRIRDRITRNGDTLIAEYDFRCRGEGRLRVTANATPVMPSNDSPEHWFKEHQWGYGVGRSGRTLRYEVRHPVWACHAVSDVEIDVDWGGIYGDQWAAMRDAEPISVVLAAGSGVEVMGARVLDSPGGGGA